MSRPSVSAFRRTLPLVAGFFTLVAVVSHARSELSDAHAFRGELAKVDIVVPEGRPPVTQESVDLAMMMFGIEVPNSALAPKLDMSLVDRGLTTRATFLERAIVTVGPAAFSSWGLLGSTLAHELEVHCEQNFLAIYFMDVLGLDGTGAAERQAYVHELRGAKRFGLEVVDAELIADTMEFYYPETGSGAGVSLMPRGVRNWLAKNVIRGGRPNL